MHVDLTSVRGAGVPAGSAVPHQITRHADAEGPTGIILAPAQTTGIDYLRQLLHAAHPAELAERSTTRPGGSAEFTGSYTFGDERSLGIID